MPDLKSELAKLKDLKFDDEPETPADPKTNDADANNQTRKIFLFYRDKPMSTVNECAEALDMHPGPVSARTAQLFNRKLVTRIKRGEEAYRYTSVAIEYPNIDDVRRAALIKAHATKQANDAKRKQLEKARAAKKAKQTKQAKQVSLAAKKAAIPKTEKPNAFNAAVMVAGLTPFQAKALFDELAKLFGSTA